MNEEISVEYIYTIWRTYGLHKLKKLRVDFGEFVDNYKMMGYRVI